MSSKHGVFTSYLTGNPETEYNCSGKPWTKLIRLKNSRLTLSVPAVFAADATEDIVSMTNPDRGTFKERKHTVKVAKERESSFI